MVNFISNVMKAHQTAENTYDFPCHIDNMLSAFCPGINCIRGFIHLDCLPLQDQSISGSYNWTVVHSGMNDDYRFGDKNPSPGIPILDENSGNFADQTFASCSEAGMKVNEQFIKALDTASQKFRLDKQHEIIDRSSFNINYTNVGVTILAIALCGWGIWKCYRRLYPLQDVPKQQTITKPKTL